MSDLLQYSETFDNYNIGDVPDGWSGTCVVSSGGYGDEADPQGLYIGGQGSLDVYAPWPRADASVPKTSADCWNIEFLLKVQSLTGCLSGASGNTPITLCNIGSIDRDDKLKIQAIPGDSTCGTDPSSWYLQVYPYKSTYRVDECRWLWVKVQIWDTYFNVYINNSITPFIQYGIPNFAPYWKAGDNRIRVSFPVDCLHAIVIDEYKFSTTSTVPTDVYTAANCFAVRDTYNNPAASAPVYLIPASSSANQVTDVYGRFSIADVPAEADVFVVYPDLKSAIITAEDIRLAKQRRLVSGVGDLTNLVIDEASMTVSGARLYYLNSLTPSFYTDSNGKFPKTSVPVGYNVFVKTSEGETLYLDSTIFS